MLKALKNEGPAGQPPSSTDTIWNSDSWSINALERNGSKGDIQFVNRIPKPRSRKWRTTLGELEVDQVPARYSSRLIRLGHPSWTCDRLGWHLYIAEGLELVRARVDLGRQSSKRVHDGEPAKTALLILCLVGDSSPLLQLAADGWPNPDLATVRLECVTQGEHPSTSITSSPDSRGPSSGRAAKLRPPWQSQEVVSRRRELSFHRRPYRRPWPRRKPR